MPLMPKRTKYRKNKKVEWKEKQQEVICNLRRIWIQALEAWINYSKPNRSSQNCYDTIYKRGGKFG